MSISSLSSSNMQYLLQQTSQVAQQVKQTVKGQVSAAQQGSFATALGSTPATSGTDPLAQISMSSLLQGSSTSASANTASATAASLLNMLV